ncbi:MAG: Ig-like domain-containing protein, partial [Acidimicrobiia bacterium]
TVDEPITLSATGTAIASGATGIAWDLDDDGAFDDAEGANPTVSFATAGTHPLRVRATSGSGSTITSQPGSVEVLAPAPLAFEVIPGADDTVVAPPVAIPVRIEIPAGVTTPVRLGPPDGPAGSFAVVEHDAAVLTVTSGPGTDPTLPLPATGPEGTVLVTPDPAFRGTTTFRYASIEDPAASALVEVTVTGNTAPVAGTDDVTVTVGSESEVPVATLLANDVDPDGSSAVAARLAEATTALRIVSVRGMANGQAWLDPDGTRIVVLATLPGTASFEYLVADAEGGVGVGVVRVSIQAVPTSSTTTSTIAPSTTSTTVPPSTTTTTAGPSTTEPSPANTTPPPPATSGVATTTLSGGRLPSTGGDPNRIVVVALLVLVAGLAVTHLTRRRRSTS